MLILRHHRIEEYVVLQPFVAFDARIAQRGILIPREREYRLIHLFGVEHLRPHEQVESNATYSLRSARCRGREWNQMPLSA